MLKFLKRKDRIGYEFLPAALEISETPPEPIGSMVIWIVFLFLIFAIIWAYIGKVDEVAVGRGKIIPAGRVKVIQPAVEGIITAIHVTEGQNVKNGQLLIELDRTMKETDIEGLQKNIDMIKLEIELLKKASSKAELEKIVLNSDLEDEMKSDLLKLVQSKESEYKSKIKSLMLEVDQSEKQLKIATYDLKKLENNLRLLKEKSIKMGTIVKNGDVETARLVKMEESIKILTRMVKKYKKLYESGAVAKNEWLEKNDELILAKKEYEIQKVRSLREKATLDVDQKSSEDDVILAEKEIEIQKIKVRQAESKYNETKNSIDSLKKEKRTSTFNIIVEKNKQVSELMSSLEKIKKGMEFQSLYAPEDGIVQGIASNTIGGVVTPAQPVLSIVPSNTPLIVEASLLNKDVGFVEIGQEVSVKFDTFPFQKYGTLKGKVMNISPDAVEDEKMGTVYKLKISLEKQQMIVNGQNVNIVPGMTVSAEIKTGERRIIEFFLEPVIKYVDEGLKLR